MKDTEKEKIIEWHKLIVMGLVNGLSHTNQDGRLEEIDFWRKRSMLFDEFAHCVLDLMTNQDYRYSEKELKRIARERYKRGEEK